MTRRNAGVWTGACLALSVLIGCDESITNPQPTPPPPLPPLVSIQPQLVRLEGSETHQLEATVAAELSGVEITWSSTNPAVADVSPTGLVVAGQAGSALITVQVGTASATAIVMVGRLFGECLVLPSPC